MTEETTDPKPSAAEWLAAFSDALGVPAPTQEEMDDLLALAGVAAHASERLAAPLACWMTARSGTTPADALARARNL